MKRTMQWLGKLALGAAVLVVLAAVVATLVGRLQLEPVLSGSMRPGIQPGDLAVTLSVPSSSLAKGDVIVFHPPGGSIPVMHRIASLRHAAGKTLITTRGDANHGLIDPWGSVSLRGAKSFRYVAAIPLLGWAPIELRRLPGGGVSLLFIASGLLLGVAALKSLKSLKSTEGRRRAATTTTTTTTTNDNIG
jgi:signal peptidase I